MTAPARLTAALANRYAIERELGAGGMATVYLARDLKHDRAVALKVLRPELAAILGGERFLQEIRISARLDHPHILTLIDSGEADGFLYYVLPYVRGESLRDKLNREKQLGVAEALAITQQVVGALDYAHRQGVVHRDIKPENILLQEGEAMLVDFGIALAVREAGGSRLTETGISLGTPQYMSPEQATGDRALDARSDVYSLAAVLYEMLAGEPPFTGPNAQAVIAKLVTEAPARLRAVRPDLPTAIDAAVMQALAKTPSDRFEGARHFAAALEGQGDATAGAGLRRRRLRIASLVGASAAILAVATLGFHRILFDGAKDPPLVIMMDSPHPDRVYDEETVRASGTNADVISDILADLPIVRQKEAAGPAWHRYEEIVRFDPDLVVMHYSTFRGSDTDDPRPGLKTFLRYFVDRDTRFLIYSRSPETRVRFLVDSLLADVEAEHPGLLARITVFGTPQHGPPNWRDPVTAGELKLAVKEILGIP